MSNEQEVPVLLEPAKVDLSVAMAAGVQRERFIFVIAVISGFLVASIGRDHEILPTDRLQGSFPVPIGLACAAQSLKFHTKKLHHYNR